MYTRVTMFRFNSEHIDHVDAKLAEIEPSIRAISGISTAYICWQKETGQAVSFAVYPSEEYAERALPQIQAIWSDVSDMLAGAPETEVFDQGRGFGS